jgi:hypothetical protein
MGRPAFTREARPGTAADSKFTDRANNDQSVTVAGGGSDTATMTTVAPSDADQKMLFFAAIPTSLGTDTAVDDIVFEVEIGSSNRRLAARAGIPIQMPLGGESVINDEGSIDWTVWNHGSNSADVQLYAYWREADGGYSGGFV